jgi:hypothetical protein
VRGMPWPCFVEERPTMNSADPHGKGLGALI